MSKEFFIYFVANAALKKDKLMNKTKIEEKKMFHRLPRRSIYSLQIHMPLGLLMLLVTKTNKHKKNISKPSGM